MSLDEYSYDIDNSESPGSSPEQVKEVSEKFKESIKKASAGITRTQKDEKKAKKYDFLLANFLVKIIIDKKYDSVLENIFKVMDFGYSSNFILGILSLINLEVSNKIREISGKEQISFDFRLEEVGEFDDNNMRKPIKDRINLWIEDMIDATTIDFSSIQNKRNIELLDKDGKVIIIFTAQIISFFLNEANISIKKDKAISISKFIISEVKSAMKSLKIEEI
ncbi:hypothetical protein BLD25_01110 [Candidatus Gracilibacteria bacterium GN02-872]|nr:hypothetical protein BLD25_01110 [Candidatus Gracilibacteria bacterium GN02-872]